MKILTFLHLAAPYVLTAATALAQTSTLHTIEQNGSRDTRLNMVFLSEGYTSGQMGKFSTDVQTALDFLFTKEPWSRYRSYFNIYRISIASNESGTDNGISGGTRDTYFQTGFNTPAIVQLNTISSTGSSRAYNLLNQHVPEYDIPIVLINDDKYGGSGGPLALATTNESSAAILEHELGHSFARLTDEYDDEYKGYPAVEYPNATAKTARSQIRWKDWIAQSTPLPTPENSPTYADPVVGLFEGANYRAVGWYRPHDNALMRNLNRPPGHVTREAILLTYYSKVSPIDTRFPLPLTQAVTSKTFLTFGVIIKTPSTGPALSVKWYVDNVEQAGQTDSTFQTPSENLGNGVHRVKVVVRDPTDWVRRDPTGLVFDEVTWTLNLSNQIDPPVLDEPLPAMLVEAAGASVILDATATGPAPITYQWLKNNAPMRPAVTSPVLNLQNISLADAATYTVKVTNPGRVVTASTKLAVLNAMVPRVIAAKGRTANLVFTASANLPPVTWTRSGTTLTNGGRYANATTRSLQVKSVVEADSGLYFFESGDFGPSAVDLLVVTGVPDYGGIPVAIRDGIVGKPYEDSLPLPPSQLRQPDSFSGRLPAGLKLDAKTGSITGIPTTPSRDQVFGDEITFTVGNAFGKVPLKIRLLIKPLPPGVAGSFTGIIHRGSSLGGPTGGRIDFSVLSTGRYSGKAVIGPDTLSFSGVASPPETDATTADMTFSLKPRHLTSPTTLSFTIEAAGDSDPATAEAEVIGQFFAWRNKWLPPESVDSFMGYYTFGLRVPTDPGNLPRGHGFGSIKVDAKGGCITTGRLADGQAFTSSAFISHFGEVPVYQTLYTTPVKGSILSVLALPGLQPSIQGFVSWLRPPSDPAKNRVYAAGFAPISLDAFGRLYNAPDSKTIPMGLAAATGTPPVNAALDFDSTLGDDPLPVDADVTLSIKAGGGAKVNAPNPKNVGFSLVPSTGAFKGSYSTKDTDPRPSPPTRPLVPRKADYQGIIVNDGGILSGFGFFLRDALPKSDGSTTPTTSPKDSGKVLLKAATP